MEEEKGKYTTYAALAKAFKDGELDGWQLEVDNDFSQLVWVGQKPDFSAPGMDEDKFNDDMRTKGRELFVGNGYNDFIDFLKDMGIPADWC